MVRFRISALLILAAAAHAGAQQPATATPTAVAVVVNEDVGRDSATAAEVRRIFLRRQRFWRDGSLIAPVNLPAASPIRVAFSRAVLGRSPRQLAEFWNQLYFQGILPPPVLDSERAILLYVARTPGSIGYVSLDALPDPDDRVGYRVLLVVRL